MFNNFLKKAALISMSAIMCISSYSVNAATAKVNSNSVVQVNSQNVSINRYKAAFLTIAFQYEGSTGKSLWSDINTINTIKNAALQDVINLQVQTDKASKMGIKFASSDQTVLDSTYSNAAAQYTQYFGQEFTNALSKVNLKPEEFNTELKNLIKSDLIVDKLKKKVTANCKPTFTKKQIQDEYISENETVTAKHILIAFSKHKDADAKKIANDVLTKLKKGENFADLATKYSEDTGTSSNGGELGQFKRGQMVQAFENAAFSLKIGVPSGLVKSDYGYHIIVVESHMIPDITKMSDTTNKDVTANLKNKSLSDYYNKQLASWNKQAKINKYDYKLEIK